MKNVIYGILFFGLVGLGFVACEKEQNNFHQTESSAESLIDQEPKFSLDFIENMVNDAYLINADENQTKSKWRKFWRKVGRWFNDHAGVKMFGDCGLNLSCGPCPGICFRSGIIDGNPNGDDTASDDVYSNGLRVYGIDILEDMETNEEYLMFRFNEDVADFVMDDNFYITKDVFLSETMSGLLEKQSVELKKGKYNVFFDEISGYYYSLVDSSMN